MVRGWCFLLFQEPDSVSLWDEIFSNRRGQDLSLHHSLCVSMIACVAVSIGAGPPTCVYVFDIRPKARWGQRSG